MSVLRITTFSPTFRLVRSMSLRHGDLARLAVGELERGGVVADVDGGDGGGDLLGRWP